MDINGVVQNSGQNYNYNMGNVNNQIITNSGAEISENKSSTQNDIDGVALDKAVKKLNKFLEDDSTHAEYSVHEDLNTIMIKIVDDKTKEVIMEVPPKKILDMVASMCKQFGLLDEKA